jgi:hypothetical protein
MALDFGTILALVLTLAIFSYIYKETVVFRLAEHIFLGLATGHGMVTAYKYIRDNAWTPMVNGEITMIMGFIFGILLLFFLKKETEWISRWPLALMTGAILGLGIRAIISVSIVRQLTGTIQPFTTTLTATSALDAILILIGTIASLAYFTYSYKHEGVLGYVSRGGRIFIMLALGGYFGNTTMSRLTLLSGRVVFILRSLGLIP